MRFDLSHTGDQLTTPVAVALYISDSENVVVDFHKSMVFIEERDPFDKYITGKWHISEHGVKVPLYDPTKLDAIIDYIRETKMENGFPVLPAGLVAQRRELFPYKDVVSSVDGEKYT